MTKTLSASGAKAIALREGTESWNADHSLMFPDMDVAGVWTIGIGHAIVDAQGNQLRGAANKEAAFALYPNGLTLAQAATLFSDESKQFIDAVNHAVPDDTTQNQFDCFVSFAYNVGAHGFQTSSALKLHNAGTRSSTTPDATVRTQALAGTLKPVNAPDALMLWIEANGQPVRGLVNRRADERLQYLAADPVPVHVIGDGVPNAALNIARGATGPSIWDRFVGLFWK